MRDKSLIKTLSRLFVVLLFVAAFLALPARAQSNPPAQNNVGTAPPQSAQTKSSDTAQPLTQTETRTQTEKGSPPPKAGEEPPATHYSHEALYGAMAVFGVLAFLFFIQMYWSNKLDQTGYLGQLYRDTLEEIEFKRLSSEMVKRFNDEGYHQEVRRSPEFLESKPPGYYPTYLARYGTPPPGYGYPDIRKDGYTNNLDVGTKNPYESSTGNLGSSSSAANQGEASKEKEAKAAQREAEQKEKQKQWDDNRKWDELVDAEAGKRYKTDLDTARGKAKELANKAINVDLSALRGRGPEFVLGFTTIVAIVFAAAALGILGKLDSQQIGTLFAAIAGYVLGRATATGKAATEPPQETTNTLTLKIDREPTPPPPAADLGAGKSKSEEKDKNKKEENKTTANELETVTP